MEIVGAKPDKDVPRDGISLMPLFEGQMEQRSRPMGFWKYPVDGHRVSSNKIMRSLLEAQKDGEEINDSAMLELDAGKITQQYPDVAFAGHSAWLNWPWKLHRIERNQSIKLELYNLEKNPQESSNVAEQNTKRVNTMKSELEFWLKSVVGSLNGNDYK